MKGIIRLIFVTSFFIVLSSIIVYPQNTDNIEVTKIKDQFYMLTSKVPYEVNFLAYVTPEGVLLVDSGQRQTGKEIRSVLKTIAPDNPEVKILINTHAHIDHTGGNLALAGEPIIVGQDLLRSTLRNYSYVLYEFPDDALPSVTFKDSMNVYFGGEKIRIISVPGSHDATDAIVHFTKSGIVCVGDIYEGLTIPSIDAYTGNVLNFPKVIDKVISLIPKDVIIVSGHDKIANVEKLKQSRDIIYYTIQKVKEEMSKGKDVAEMQKENILKDWAAFENGFGGNMNDWIDQLANAGPSKFLGSTAGVLYKILLKNNADSAIEKYKELQRDYPTGYPFSAYELTRTGDWLLEKGRTDDAVKMFEFSVKAYPESTLGYTKLGELYMKNGNTELAIKNFEKLLNVDPGNKNAEKMLRQLRNKK
jgi:cyclase